MRFPVNTEPGKPIKNNEFEAFKLETGVELYLGVPY
jgi:hypothetical protein